MPPVNVPPCIAYFFARSAPEPFDNETTNPANTGHFSAAPIFLRPYFESIPATCQNSISVPTLAASSTQISVTRRL